MVPRCDKTIIINSHVVASVSYIQRVQMLSIYRLGNIMTSLHKYNHNLVIRAIIIIHNSRFQYRYTTAIKTSSKSTVK